jgi:hypothetical protein
VVRKTKTVLEALVGVIVADKVVSTGLPDVVVVADAVIALTTCNTVPAGIDALVIPLDEVVNVPANVVFCEASTVTAVVPLV